MGRKLYVGGLSFETTEAELRTLFEQAGTVESATVITDRFSGRSKGFGFVEMSTDAEARQAITELSGKMLGERTITVEEARPPRDDRGGPPRGRSGGRGR
jgi:RNA recognition motif-containing protein